MIKFFIELGRMVEGIVVDLTARRSPIPSGGLEIKLKLYFRHTGVSSVEQLRSFLSRYEWEKKKQPMIEKHDCYHDTEDDNLMTMLQDHIMKKFGQLGNLARHSWGTVGAQLRHSWGTKLKTFGHSWGTVGAQLGHSWGIKLLGAQLGHS